MVVVVPKVVEVDELDVVGRVMEVDVIDVEVDEGGGGAAPGANVMSRHMMLSPCWPL